MAKSEEDPKTLMKKTAKTYFDQAKIDLLNLTLLYVSMLNAIEYSIDTRKN